MLSKACRAMRRTIQNGCTLVELADADSFHQLSHWGFAELWRNTNAPAWISGPDTARDGSQAIEESDKLVRPHNKAGSAAIVSWRTPAVLHCQDTNWHWRHVAHHLPLSHFWKFAWDSFAYSNQVHRLSKADMYGVGYSAVC